MRIFKDREEASLELSGEIKKEIEVPEKTIVVGILRGGAYMSKIIGNKLNVDFSVLPVKKISPFESPETGFGAVVFDGTYIYDSEYARILGIDEEDIEMIVNIRLIDAKRQYEVYKDFIVEDFKDKDVFLVDDGTATGYTALAAVKFIRKTEPRKVILAVPVISKTAYDYIKPYFDKIIALEVQDSIYFAVGMFYEDFRQYDDEYLLRFLKG